MLAKKKARKEVSKCGYANKKASKQDASILLTKKARI